MSASMYRGQLDRKRRQRLDAEKKVGELRRKEAEKRVNGQRDFPVGGQLISLLADT